MVLYIDPGTGSMLFTILIGVVSVAVFFFRALIVKIKFLFSGGKSKADKNAFSYVIFSDDKRYWSNFKPVCDEFEKRETEVHYFTASEDDPALKADYKYVKCEYIGEGNKAFSRMNLLKADIVLSTTPSLDVFQWKRSKDVKYYVHILHAVGFSFYRIYGIDYFDAILLQGPFFEHQIRALEKRRNLPSKEIKVVGLPYLDTMYERASKTPAPKNERPVVLLAPSWGENSILYRYGERTIDALIDTGYEIVIRPHPQSFKSEKDLMDRLMAKYPDGEKVFWNRDNDNFDILSRADIMISDYSGVVFDYALVFNKPVLYADFEFDDSIYDAHWIDEEPWLFQKLHKIGRPIADDFDKTIKNTIDDCLSSGDIAEEIEIARKEGWNNIGNSAKLTVDYLIAKREELLNGKDDSL